MLVVIGTRQFLHRENLARGLPVPSQVSRRIQLMPGRLRWLR